MPYIAGVSASAKPTAPTPVLDRERGRLDDSEQLRARLADAPADYLSGALENDRLGPDELRLVLQNRSATAEIVARIGRNRSWMRTRDVRLAFVSNPAAPGVLARQVLPHLFWRDLAEIAANLRLSPALRRDAEKILRSRLPELTVGERTALSRRPSRGIVEMLREDLDGAVLQGLSQNARATESDLVRILARRDVPPGFLGWLADQSPWGQRREVRLALVRHPRTPAASALRLIPALSPRDLDDLRRDAMAPRLVRVAAERCGTAPRQRRSNPRSTIG